MQVVIIYFSVVPIPQRSNPLAKRPLLLLRGFFGLVNALADTGFVTLAAGALLGFGMLLTHDENPRFMNGCFLPVKK